MRTSKSRKRLKPATIAARRRKEREENERAEMEVELACNIILQATSKSNPTRKMQRVATEIVIASMKNDIVELPTGGPVNINLKLYNGKVKLQELRYTKKIKILFTYIVQVTNT